MNYFLNDPAKNRPSVSLTLLILSFILLIAAGITQIIGKIQTVGPFDQLFYACAGLYFGRNINISKDQKILTKTNEDKENDGQ